MWCVDGWMEKAGSHRPSLAAPGGQSKEANTDKNNVPNLLQQLDSRILIKCGSW